jgi:hypothetical protein
MFVGPVTHVPCDLNTQRAIMDARRDRAARVALGIARRSPLDRLLRRRRTGEVVDPAALVHRGEDVAHALRY